MAYKSLTMLIQTRCVQDEKETNFMYSERVTFSKMNGIFAQSF
jgi:hypothetical protein